MLRRKSNQFATQGIAAVLLLFGFAFAASAEQMMRALPAPAAVQPIAAPIAAQPTVVAPIQQMKLPPPHRVAVWLCSRLLQPVG